MPSVRRGFTIIELLIVCMIILIIAAIAVPQWARARETSRRQSCLANMQKLEQAKDLWAMENRYSSGAVATQADLTTEYVQSYPNCPSAGTYTVNPVDTHVECSYHGQLP